MANTQKYLNHLLQNTGITPACSEEERAAADIVADIFRDHGFQPEIQEFSASSSAKVAQAAMGIMVFAGAVLMGIGGAVGVVGAIVAIVGAVLFVMERTGHPVLSNVGAGGLSQNVIAYHKASGPLASPRNRPVVVVAHYDSPRADLLSQEPYASYRPILVKLLPFAMVAPAVMAVVRLLPVPGPAKIVLWVLSIIVALIPLANAVAIIANKYVLPYTSGSVCNKSSVAAMLGVMDAVSPYQGANEFPGDVPFEQYIEEQRTYAPVMELVDEDAFDIDSEQDYEESEGEQLEDQEEEGVEQETKVSLYEEEPSDSAATAMWSALDAETVVAAGVEAARRVSQAEVSAEQLVTDPGSTVAMTSQQFAAALLDAGVQVEDSVQPVQEEAAFTSVDQVSDAEAQPVSETPALPVNASGNIRYGVEVLRALGMVSASCAIEYEPGAMAVPVPAPSSRPVVQPDAPVASQVAEQAQLQTGIEAAEEDGAQVAVAVDSYEPQPTSTFSEPVLAMDDSADEEFVEEQVENQSEEDYDESPDRSAVQDDVFDDEDLEPQRVDQTSMWTVPAEFGGTSAYTGDDSVEKESSDEPLDNQSSEFEPNQAVQPSSYLDYGDVADDYILEAEYEIIDDGLYDEADEEAEDVEPNADQDDSVLEEESVGEDVQENLEDDSSDDDEQDDSTDGAAIDEEPAPEANDEEDASVDDAEEESVSADLDVEVEDGPAAVIDVEHIEINEAEEQVCSDDEFEDVTDSVVDVNADTQLFQMPDSAMEPGATQAMPMPAATERTVPHRPVETVDSLMAQISQPQPAVHVPPRSINVPDISVPANARRIPAVPGIEAFQKQNAVQNRSPLFDLPDPSVKPADPFVSASPSTTSAASRGFSVVSSAPTQTSEDQPFETIKAPAPQPKKQKRGLGGLFGRKKKQQDSMSEWLGVDDDFDAKRNGGEIGTWDNFDGDDGSWKGGATGIDGVTELELRDAITSMGDDELLGHDIWFVATGASECGNAGLKAFLDTHRDKLRGVFLINLESVGAGQIAMLSTEGDTRVLKGDKRIMKLVQRVSSDFHHEIGAIDMPYVHTDAYAAMNMSLRSLTIAGIDGSHFACSHSEEDMPYNVDERNVNKVADVVTEVIRRS